MSDDPVEQIDPFVKRVVTVKPGDVVIYRYQGRLTPELIEELSTKLKAKMGSIPFVVIDDQFDLTVLKASNAAVTQPLMA